MYPLLAAPSLSLQARPSFPITGEQGFVALLLPFLGGPGGIALGVGLPVHCPEARAHPAPSLVLQNRPVGLTEVRLFRYICISMSAEPKPGLASVIEPRAKDMY